jgi:hypothetical protein
MKESMIDMDVEGNEIKYFSSKFLVQKYLKYSSEDIKLNEKLKDEEIQELNLAGGENSDPDNLKESIDYDKLSDMIVEKLTASKNMITEVDEDNAEENKDEKPKKSKKKSKKSDEEE